MGCDGECRGDINLRCPGNGVNDENGGTGDGESRTGSGGQHVGSSPMPSCVVHST